MATKKIVKKAKKALKPVVKKKAVPAKKKAIAKKTARYACNVCGLVVSVDRFSGIAYAHKLVCCGKVMKKK
ncbi:MAG TPA: hypothetical protein VF451_02345 [Acidobacteriota bacterium]